MRVPNGGCRSALVLPIVAPLAGCGDRLAGSEGKALSSVAPEFVSVRPTLVRLLPRPPITRTQRPTPVPYRSAAWMAQSQADAEIDDVIAFLMTLTDADLANPHCTHGAYS